MLSRLMVGVLAFAAAAMGTEVKAQYDENRIRTAASTTVIQAQGGVVTFSITGVDSDYMSSPIYSGPLAGAPYYLRFQNSNGQYTYRFSVTILPWMGGQILYLYRGNDLLDGDRILWG